MRRTLPVVYSKSALQTVTLHSYQDREGVEIALDSEEWFAWLAREQSFRFTYWKKSGQFINVTIRPEKRGQRTYWQGWKTIKGRTTKKYIAPSAKMTKAKLDAVGEWFYEQVQASTEVDQEMKLYAAVVDLTWLVEQLMAHCQQPVLITQAQQELERIRHSFGN